MSLIRITAGDFSFVARFEETAAPKTVAAFRGMLPYRESLIHVRWSGEACWIPMGDYDLGLGPEAGADHVAHHLAVVDHEDVPHPPKVLCRTRVTREECGSSGGIS